MGQVPATLPSTAHSLSTLDPDSMIRFAGARFRLSISPSQHKLKNTDATHLCLKFVGDGGIEPPTSTMSM